MTDFLRRHILRLLMLLAGCAALLDSPPAVIGGLPGPGLWPRACGAALLICALLLPAPQAGRPADSAGKRPALGLIAASLVFIAGAPLAGWLPATAAAAFLSASSAGCPRREAAMLTALLCGGLWLLVEHLLGWPLPEGLLWEMLGGAA